VEHVVIIWQRSFHQLSISWLDVGRNTGFPSNHCPVEVPQHQAACTFRTMPGHPSHPENGLAFVPVENRDTARDII